MISDSLLQEIGFDYSKSKGVNSTFRFERSIYGGSINRAAAIICDNKKFFLKWNNKSEGKIMFSKEIKGLETLHKYKGVKIPNVIISGTSNDESYLLLEYIDSSPYKDNSFFDFGRELANQHRHSYKKFGFKEDNYIGSLAQHNEYCDTWNEFFYLRRLEPMLKMAFNNKLVDKTLLHTFDIFISKIDEIFPAELPSLLHGDLWQGNYIFDPNGRANIFDPAVYYGHREMDISMSKLFGGFENSFYDGYNQQFPLEKGWKSRVNYCNLYPLLVHLNLFGSSYLGEIKTTLKNFRDIS